MSRVPFLLVEQVQVLGAGYPQHPPVRQQRPVGETVRGRRHEGPSGRHQGPHRRRPEGLGEQGSRAAGGVSAGLVLLFEYDDGGVLGQVPGRGRAGDPRADHHHIVSLGLSHNSPSEFVAEFVDETAAFFEGGFWCAGPDELLKSNGNRSVQPSSTHR